MSRILAQPRMESAGSLLRTEWKSGGTAERVGADPSEGSGKKCNVRRARSVFQQPQ